MITPTDIFNATEGSVYEALAQHLKPHKLKNLTDPDNKHRNGTWIHPFEIITIGGDDVMLIVPANKALAIANTIGREFEKQRKDSGQRVLTSVTSQAEYHNYGKKSAS